ncbi:response regulator [Romeria aff. gracilis LEGE 07310]|uniref:Response regulator n=2 Tax=Vasconcelosia TaxID=3366328 RepID=A0A8J7DBF5_9CYAN|nr:response regulator [Romeria aff. gracilis LEGE 07310]
MLMVKYEPGMETAAEASSGAEAIAQFHQHRPDVTLMDLRLGDMNGVDAIATIRQDFPDARIVILTTYDKYLSIKIYIEEIVIPSIA